MTSHKQQIREVFEQWYNAYPLGTTKDKEVRSVLLRCRKDVLEKLDGCVCIPTKQLEDFDVYKWLRELGDTEGKLIGNYTSSQILKLFIKKELLEK